MKVKLKKDLNIVVDVEIINEVHQGKRFLGVVEKTDEAFRRPRNFNEDQLLFTPLDFCMEMGTGGILILELSVEEEDGLSVLAEEAKKELEELKQAAIPN